MRRHLLWLGLCPAFIVFHLNAAVRTAPGDLDTTFGGTGIVVTDVNNVSNEGKSLVVQPDGKIIVGGSGVDLTMVRYSTNGSIDTTFGTNGIVTYSPTPYSESVNAMALQSDGKIVVAGQNNFPPDGIYRFIIVRFNSDGTVDQSFGTNGLATVSLGSTVHFARSLLVQSDGKIVVGGEGRDTGGNAVFALARVDPTGGLDLTFDGDGKVSTIFPDSTFSSIQSIRTQSDGKIVAAGIAGFPSTFRDFAAARYNTDGSLDSSFGTAGRTTTHFSNNDSARDLVIQADGRIVLGGQSNNDFAFTLARYDPNGVLDASFGNGGKVALPVGASESYSSGLALQPDGKLVALGASGFFPNRDATLLRFNTNGSVDTTFGVNGIVVTPITPGSFDDPTAIKLDSGGRILITGRTDNGGPVLNHNFFVVRYLNDTFATVIRSPFDFDGDGKADLSVFRPSVGEWYYQESGTNVTRGFGFGSSTDRVTPADFTGDGKTDIAFFRPSTGDWFVLRSEDSTFFAFPFGRSGDIPAPADFDGDGEADPTVYRPSAQTWFILKSTGGVSSVPFGLPNDVPVSADYDGDGMADVGIFRPDVGQWWILRSSNGSVFAATFGTSTDKPVVGDYTGDGKADVAFFRPAEGSWYVLRSEDQSFFAFPFGNSADKPAPADFDGDGKYDAAVFRPSDTNWYILKSTGGVQIQQFGAPNDVPLPGAFVP